MVNRAETIRILFDAQAFLYSKHGGISRYFFELMSQFYAGKSANFRLAIASTPNEYLNTCRDLQEWVYKEKQMERRSFSPSKIFHRIAEPLHKLTRNTGPNEQISVAALKDGKFDVFHPTYYNPYFLKHLAGKPFVLTVHDCIHEIFPELLMWDHSYKSKKELAIRASKIIAVSECTKKDLVSLYGIDPGKISVIYHGNSLDPNQQNHNLSLPEEFILYVGSRGFYKNFYFFCRAFAQLLGSHPQLNLVCMGGGEFNKQEKEYFSAIGIQQNISYIAASDASLVTGYKRAHAFVYPSLYEGFGIPILESFACECPVICSETSSLPEVAGDAAIYFCPKDVFSISEAISSVLNNDVQRRSLIDAGARRLKEFSWARCAQETQKIYEMVM